MLHPRTHARTHARYRGTEYKRRRRVRAGTCVRMYKWCVFMKTTAAPACKVSGCRLSARKPRARVCVTRRRNHGSPRTGLSAGAVVEFSNDFSFSCFCSSWGSSTPPPAYSSLIPVEPLEIQRVQNLLSVFPISSNHPFNGPGHCCRHRSNRHVRTPQCLARADFTPNA